MELGNGNDMIFFMSDRLIVGVVFRKIVDSMIVK